MVRATSQAGCGKDRTWPVGSKPAGNSLDGLQDMSGNVREWTSTASGADRVLRGGSYRDGSPGDFIAGSRATMAPAWRHYNNGFRCVDPRGPRRARYA